MWKPWVWVAAEDRRSWSLVLCVWDQKICDCSNCATSILLQTRLSSRWYVSPDSTLMPVLLKFAGICWNWNSMLVQTWFNPDPICGLNSMENYASRKHAIPGNQERLLWVDNAGKQETSCTFIWSQNMFRQNRSNCLVPMKQRALSWTSVSFLTLVCPIFTHSSNLIT